MHQASSVDENGEKAGSFLELGFCFNFLSLSPSVFSPLSSSFLLLIRLVRIQ